ncbi:MAG: hypothetical protein GQ578_02360 [Desulfuromonadaceae bacterium]|nr:hypothetical protein [Desulfuromonadaceae bacterium]
MSNELMIPEGAEIPEYILNPELAKQANEDAAAGISTGYAARIKLNGKAFVLVDGNGNETPVLPGDMVLAPDGQNYMPIIVLRAKKEIQKAFYLEAYNPGEEGKAPDCFSNDGVSPDQTAPAKQCDSCAACPMNAFGSGKDQSGNATKGKACSDSKILAVFVPKIGVHKLKLPPASLQNWGLFVKQLTARGIPVGNIKTLVGFDTTAPHPVVTFQFGGFVQEGLLPKLADMAQSPEAEEIATDRITGQAKLPAPAAAQTQSAIPTAQAQELPDDLGLGEVTSATPEATPVEEPKEEPAPPTDEELATICSLEEPILSAAEELGL